MDCDSSEEESGSESLSTEEEEGAQLADNEEEDEEEFPNDQDADEDLDLEEPEDGSGEEEEEGAAALREEVEHRRADITEEVAHLEAEFLAIKESLFAERLRQVELKLAEVREGRAVEYLTQLAVREENCRIRKQVAVVRRSLQIESARNVFESRELGVEYDSWEEQRFARAAVHRQLTAGKNAALRGAQEADLQVQHQGRGPQHHNSAQGNHHAWQASVGSGPRGASSRRRKAVAVAAPYIIYMLEEGDILEDLAAIKAALKQRPSTGTLHHSPRLDWPLQQTVVAGGTPCTPPAPMVTVICEERRLVVNGDVFQTGHRVLVDFPGEIQRDPATLISVSQEAVVFKTSTGRHRKVSLTNLRRGRISLSPCP